MATEILRSEDFEIICTVPVEPKKYEDLKLFKVRVKHIPTGKMMEFETASRMREDEPLLEEVVRNFYNFIESKKSPKEKK